MKEEKLWLLGGMIVVSLGMLIAALGLPDSHLNPAVAESGFGLSTGGTPTLQIEAIRADAGTGPGSPLQQLIASGRLEPPPGNTDKMYSIAVPFAAGAPAVSSKLPRQASPPGSNAQARDLLIASQPNADLAGAAISQRSMSSTPAETTHGTTAQQALPVQLASDSFDTPPGIGSAVGYR